jgi:hypothetical protein
MKGKSDETPWTMSIPEFGKHYYGLGRSASYAAAARGDIPVFRVGGKLMGLPHAAEAQLSGQGSAAARPAAPHPTHGLPATTARRGCSSGG